MLSVCRRKPHFASNVLQNGHCEANFEPLDIVDQNGTKSDHLMDWLAQKVCFEISKTGIC
jgi:hypothetical protein